MSHDEQLAWEARAGKPAAVASFFAALMAIVSGVYLQVALTHTPDGADEALRAADREPNDFIVSGVLQTAAILLLIPVLLYLYRVTRYRRSQVMPATAVLVVIGGITLAVVGILQKVEFVDVGHGFFPEKAAAAAAAGKDIQDVAEDYISDEVSPALQGIALAGSIALAFSMIMISLNAMRAGLLSRFMGILGIFVGILLVIPLGVQILQLFWFAALGLLFLDRWPGGRGPAWQTGEEIRWPGAAEQREEIERRRAEREGLLDPPEEAEPEAERPASRKRRKKKR